MTSWSIRLYEATDEVVWAAQLTLLWTAGTLAGGVLLGVGPATVAAYTLARRHASGESSQAWSGFVAAYRREFRGGTVLVLPIVVAAGLLVVNYRYFAGFGPAAAAPRLATMAALIALVVITAHLLPMAVHFDLPARLYLPKASLFALTHPAGSVLLLFLLTATGYLVAVFPVLVVVAVGGWIQLNTWLCLRLFAENEARREARGIS